MFIIVVIYANIGFAISYTLINYLCSKLNVFVFIIVVVFKVVTFF